MPNGNKPISPGHGLYKTNWGKFLKTLYFVIFAACGFATIYPQPVGAHELIGSVSNSIIIVEGRIVDYYLSIPQSVTSSLRQLSNGNDHLVSQYLLGGLKLTTWDSECKADNVEKPVGQPSGNLIIHIAFKCPREVKDLSINSSLFYDFDGKHIQFINLADRQDPGRFTHKAVMTSGSRLFHIVDVKTGGYIFLSRAHSFFILGIKHILSGYDHMLFLLAILMMMTTFRNSLKVITSFTVAHSITIALAFFEIVSIQSGIVEPLIALSIVYAGAENIIKPDHQKRSMVAFIFGLIHGLGFVGALKEITVSNYELITSLLSFNLGIEAGQIVIASVMLPSILYMRKKPSSPVFLKWSSACIVLAGLFWFTKRVLIQI